MEHLLEIRWDDPIAEAVARILARVPEGVEQTTGQMPQGQGRAFGVYRSESLEVLEDLARAAASVGARVWITSITGGASMGSA